MAGKIAAAAQNRQVAPQRETPLGALKAMLNTDDAKRRLSETMDENAGAFSASIIELFSGDKFLQMCKPAQVLAESFKAASLKLPINKQLGFAYIVAYKNSKTGQYEAQFQLGYKGYIQLAQRSGAYKYINADVVYEGELAGRDKLTGEIDLSGERLSDKITGYFAHIELLNGYRKTMYMSLDEVTAHAKKRSKAFSSGPWQSDYDAMALKTCLRMLISKYGIMSVEMSRAIVSEYSADEIRPPETIIADDYAPDVAENDIGGYDTETGEVIGAPEGREAAIND